MALDGRLFVQRSPGCLHYAIVIRWWCIELVVEMLVLLETVGGWKLG